MNPSLQPQPAPAVAIDNLGFGWPGHDPLFGIEALTVMPGERVFMHGPSGSGKSTLLSLMAGVLLPNRGRVRILGVDLGELGTSARDRFRADHVGFVFQMFNLLPFLGVLDNVLLPCRFSRLRRTRAQTGRSERDQALRLLSALQLDSAIMARARVSDLSIGQQQRVAVARALIGGPELLLADEPTSALDSATRNAFIKLLFQECERSGTAVIFVSHDRSLAKRFDRHLTLQDYTTTPGAPA